MTPSIHETMRAASQAVHQAQVENGRWIDIDPQGIDGYRSCFANVRTLYTEPGLSALHTGVRAAEIVQLLNDLERVGAKASGEMIGICGQAGAVINALLAVISAEQLS